MPIHANVADYRERARRRLPAPVFDFFDAGSGIENARNDNTDAFARYRPVPRVGRDVRNVDTSTSVFGQKISFPMVVAPMGGLGFIWPDAEKSIAAAAGKLGVMMGLSTYSTLPMEEVARAGAGPKMFQLYLLTDEWLTQDLIARAKQSGFKALAVTIDVPVTPSRPRVDRWNLDGALGPVPLRTKLAIARHPEWIRRQKQAKTGFTDLANRAAARGHVIGADFYAKIAQQNMNWGEIEKVGRRWDGPFAVKGVMSGDDARRAVDCGAGTVVICNHGGIGLDHAPASLSLVEEVTKAVSGNAEVIQCGGLRQGSGIATALAMGARACMTGRPLAYGVAADGEEGATRVLELLKKDFEDAMRLCGCTSVADFEQIKIQAPQRF
ncbi:MAG: alpha-hydroxy acid oxidase [Caulobacterales bacterium]